MRTITVAFCLAMLAGCGGGGGDPVDPGTGLLRVTNNSTCPYNCGAATYTDGFADTICDSPMGTGEARTIQVRAGTADITFTSSTGCQAFFADVVIPGGGVVDVTLD